MVQSTYVILRCSVLLISSARVMPYSMMSGTRLGSPPWNSMVRQGERERNMSFTALSMVSRVMVQPPAACFLLDAWQ